MKNWEDRVIDLMPKAEKDSTILDRVWSNAMEDMKDNLNESLSRLLFHMTDAELKDLALGH